MKTTNQDIKHKIGIAKSPLTNEWYLFRCYDDRGNGNFIIKGKKENITDNINKIIEQAQLQAKEECLKMIDEEIEVYIKLLNSFKEREIVLKAGELKEIRISDLKSLKQSIHNKIEGESK